MISRLYRKVKPYRGMVLTFGWLAIIIWGFQNFGLGYGMLIFLGSSLIITLYRFYKIPMLINWIRLVVQDLNMKGYQPKRRTWLNFIWVWIYGLVIKLENKQEKEIKEAQELKEKKEKNG